MIPLKSTNKFTSAGLISAFAASLCCITPVIALFAGTSSIAATFSWIEPARPYLIGVSVVALALAWYLKLKPQAANTCCAVDGKPKFIQSKTFLMLITIFAAVVIAFPYYSKIFFPKTEKQIVFVEKSNIQSAEFKISGMTCEGCTEEVKHEVNKLQGILKSEASYQNANAMVQFDNSKTSIAEITKAINSTGYKVTETKLK
ncbi:MAG TPA: mercuric transport protein MerTP [Chitinophagaceae bacterium]